MEEGGRNSKGQFVKGHKSTEEETLKRSRALAESWKSRPDYIGDLTEKYPRIFNSWRAIRHTKKGKSAGCEERWSDFRTFFNDVFPTYQPGLLFRRKNTCKKWGPDNFMWVESDEAGELRAGIMLEYNGKVLSLRQWARELGVPYGAMRTRYFKHRDEYSVEEILFGKKCNRGAKEAKDVKTKPEMIRAKASKMISSYTAKDIKNQTSVCDIDIKWMIENILLKPCVYCGDTHRVGCDRIDNSRGHTKDNVVPCCVECNTAKNNYFSYDEMRRLGAVIAEIKKDRGIDLNENAITDYSEWASHDASYVWECNKKKTYQFSTDGKLIAEYDSINAAAYSVGASPGAIGSACDGGYSGLHRSHGFVWSHSKEFPIQKQDDKP